MKQHFLLFAIILCSLGSWIAWAYLFNTYINPPLEPTTPVIAPQQVKNTPPPAPADMATSLESTITRKVQEIAPSVVSIIIKKDLVIYKSDPFGFFRQPAGTVERKVGGGTGFFIRADGKIITNKHVVSDKNAVYTVITHTGEEYDATVIAVDPLNDLAIIKIDDTKIFPTLEVVENMKSVSVWQFAIAIWNALAEFQNSVSLGIVSWKERSIESQNETLSGLIQTDTAINPWNSGGPLINLEGKVMWINTAIVNNSEGIGFAIALTTGRIDYILESIKKSGTIKRPFIGINYVANSPTIMQEFWLWVDYWAYIIDEAWSVISGSSAEIAGIEPGDIILEVDGKEITPKNNLGIIVQNKIPGETLTLKILKKSGQEEVVELILWEL